MLTVIAACARDGAIGRAGDIPWHLPEDLGFFRRETIGGAVIMGRRTRESLPVFPLPQRTNIVVSRAPGDDVSASPEAALRKARAAGHARIYCIGGADLYRAMLPLADRLLLTEVDLEVPDADTFFPAYDPFRWRLASVTGLRGEDPAAALREYLRASL
ncbi:dihydrofolate reductase [Cereibacter sphaeroides]|uniref:dihydrofolate reductase n=1 Tax=Cereibacter sphaeroides TaxID=1063 RepID=UPI001F3BF2EA|nr:dihydrofolate reductase [Cereibacter sphaeroides]MCE6958804.1 dihydrofolate reductase [Cereibacter sphaeroides]MCE6973322.1 dihydrofolate reductase [Cereibacter sphaeroides]